VKKLMEDENYRNFVLSRLNVNLDKKYSDEEDHIEDVVGYYLLLLNLTPSFPVVEIRILTYVCKLRLRKTAFLHDQRSNT